MDATHLVRSCRRGLAGSSDTGVIVLLYSCCCDPDFDLAQLLCREPIRCSRLAEHARHPGAVASRLGSKRRPRAARAVAARAGRWWRWLDSNGVTFFCTSTIGVPVEVSTAAVRVTWYNT